MYAVERRRGRVAAEVPSSVAPAASARQRRAARRRPPVARRRREPALERRLADGARAQSSARCRRHRGDRRQHRDGAVRDLDPRGRRRFRRARAELSPTARAAHDARLAAALRDLPNPIRVEGHTDDVPIHTRAVRVELGAVDGARDARRPVPDRARRHRARRGCRRPATASSTRGSPTTRPTARARNRRVDIVVLERRDAARPRSRRRRGRRDDCRVHRTPSSQRLLGRPVRRRADRRRPRGASPAGACSSPAPAGRSDPSWRAQIAACAPAAPDAGRSIRAQPLSRSSASSPTRWPSVARRAGARRRHARAADPRARAAPRGPHVVYHAAAYKHVTMAERAVCAACGGQRARHRDGRRSAARAVGARFVLISSDKAAVAAQRHGRDQAARRAGRADGARRPTFRPVVVRFGNVLGSSGSVLSSCASTCAPGQPIPITDPDATRYFMTAGEAVALVLKADLLGDRPRPSGSTWASPVRIGDLAERLLALEGRRRPPARPD